MTTADSDRSTGVPGAPVYPCLRGKAVVISGGATGIGAVLVEAFATQGARVGFVDKNEVAGQALCTRMTSRGFSVSFEAVDVTKDSEYEPTLYRLAKLHGPCRVLVNNAANDQRHRSSELDGVGFDALVAVNLRHAYVAIRALALGMSDAGGGAIINMGSIGWMLASAGYPAYAAAKAGMHGLTRSFARELGPSRVRVNTLVPGWVMTERQLSLWVDAEAERLIDQSQCMPGRVLPSDVAAMALFLASDGARMCSAQNFIVDGGWV